MKLIIASALAPFVVVIVIADVLGHEAAQFAVFAMVCLAVGGVLVHYWEQDRADQAARRILEEGRWPMRRR